MKTPSWRSRAPRLVRERRAVLSRCGTRAFLDPERMRYPVVAKRGGCKPNCSGLRYAYARARQQHAQAIAKRARAIACRMGCPWTVRGGC